MYNCENVDNYPLVNCHTWSMRSLSVKVSVVTEERNGIETQARVALMLLKYIRDTV